MKYEISLSYSGISWKYRLTFSDQWLSFLEIAGRHRCQSYMWWCTKSYRRPPEEEGQGDRKRENVVINWYLFTLWSFLNLKLRWNPDHSLVKPDQYCLVSCYLIKRRQSFDSCSEVSSSQQQLQDLCQLNALLFILSGLHLGIKHTIITMIIIITTVIICRKLVWAYGLLKCCRARHCCRNAAL